MCNWALKSVSLVCREEVELQHVARGELRLRQGRDVTLLLPRQHHESC